MTARPEVHIGIDVGGTHTDVAAAVDGRIVRGKALTTYDDFGKGVVEAVGVVAGVAGMSCSPRRPSSPCRPPSSPTRS
jgi:N-methylhydantoinase A/oxoprolinase/acetone carboxylase beta subunit